MPSSRRLALGAAGALALLLAAGLAARRRRAPEERRPLAAVAPEALVRLERRTGGETLTLVRRAGTWTAEGLGPARPELCRALAEGAQRLALGPKVSDDPGAYDDYGLSDAAAIRLRAFAENAPEPALTVYLGRPAYGGALYARLADEAPVFVETGIPADTLALPATAFLLK
jgi:hypothetical protein